MTHRPKYTTKKITQMAKQRRSEDTPPVKPVEPPVSQPPQEAITDEIIQSADGVQPAPPIEPIQSKEPEVIINDEPVVELAQPVAEIVKKEPREEIKIISVPVAPVKKEKLSKLKTSSVNEFNYGDADSDATSFPLTLVLSLTLFYLAFIFAFPESIMNAAVNLLNAVITDISGFIFSFFRAEHTSIPGGLMVRTYKVPLEGDPTAFHSLVLLSTFAIVWAYIQKTTWVRKAIIIASLFPLVLLANTLRVILTAGVAINAGAATADSFFHGFFVMLVFGMIVVGIVVLAGLLRSHDS